MPATYEPIATTTLSSASAIVTFSSIPSTYTDLRLVVVGTASSQGTMKIRFNNDSDSNYSRLRLNGSGSSVSTGQGNNLTNLEGGTEFNDNSMPPSFFACDVFSYANTSVNKTALLRTQSDRNGSGEVAYVVSAWRSTAAINRLDFSLNWSNWNFAIGTTATLYGILRA